MDWLTGGKNGEAKRLISQLADSTKRARATQDLIRMSTDAVPALIEALHSRDPNLRPLVGLIIARIGSPTIPALTKSLGEAHPLVRVQVCDILGQIKDRAAVPALLEALHGEFYTVQAKAAAALGNIGDPQAIQPLLTALKDKEDDVRASSAFALGKFNDPATFDGIADLLLDDPKIEVRQAAARAFAETKNPKNLPYLLQALRDSFWWYEREQTADELLQAIEAMGPAAVDPLVEALKDPEGTVRKFAARVLGRIGDKRAIESLGTAIYDLHFDVGKAATESLADLGTASLPVLKEALTHPEASIREHAVSALGKIKDADTASLLMNALHDPERVVQMQVIRSLGELRDPKSIPYLQEIAANRLDREMSTLARQALQNFS
jgi:HEAT repeat protein